MKALLLALMLSVEPKVETRTEECTYAGFCCQFDWIGKSGCRLRVLPPLCRGSQTVELRDGKVVKRSECK